MNEFSRIFLAVGALGLLAGCQASGGAAAVANAEGPTGRCITEAAKLYGVTVADVAVSAEYPSGTGSAVEGSVNKDLSGIKMFRCEFDSVGAFQRIFEPKPGE